MRSSCVTWKDEESEANRLQFGCFVVTRRNLPLVKLQQALRLSEDPRAFLACVCEPNMRYVQRDVQRLRGHDAANQPRSVVFDSLVSWFDLDASFWVSDV